MEILYFVFFIILIFINIGAIISVWIEDIIYSTKDKILKTIFIIFLPFIGAFRELYFSRKYHKIHKNNIDSNSVSDTPGSLSGLASNGD